MARKDRSTGTPAILALTAAGVGFSLRPYEHPHPGPADGVPRHYGAEAAEALDVDPYRIFKTLLADTGGRLVCAVVPVAAQLDLKALASATGAKKATMADPDAATRSTGYVLGGISPLGQRTRLPTVVDRSALAHPTVLVSAGRRGLQVELDPGDLVRLTGATTALIATGVASR